MSSTENSYENEKKDIDALKYDFADILKQIQELQRQLQNRKGNVDVLVKENTPVEVIKAIDNNFLYDQIEDNDMNSKFDNKFKSDSQNNSISGFTPNLKKNSKILPPLETPDYTIKYTDDKIQEYHNVANNESPTQTMDNEKKYNIIINAEKRLEYLKNNNNKDTHEYRDEYRRLNDIYNKYNKCKNSGFCKKNHSFTEKTNALTPRGSSQVSPRGSPQVLPRESPRPDEYSEYVDDSQLDNSKNIVFDKKYRPNFIKLGNGHRYGGTQRIYGIKKTRKTRHRKTKRRRTNKRSHSHKKRH